MGALFGMLLNFLGGGVVDSVLGYFERKAASDNERLRIQSIREKNANAEAAGVVKRGMEFPLFWIPWLMAAIPTAGWYGWGMLDTAFNGALPDVASIPPGLLPWAETVWNNIFYSGAGVAGAQLVARALGGRK